MFNTGSIMMLITMIILVFSASMTLTGEGEFFPGVKTDINVTDNNETNNTLKILGE